MSNMKRVLGNRATFVLATWVVYVLAFIPLYRLVGSIVASLAILPVVVTGWLFGIRAGLLAGLLTFPLNMLLTAVVTGTVWEMMTPGGLFGTVLILLIGAVAGRLHDLGEQVKRELAERKRVEEALKEVVKKAEQAKEEWESTADSLPELICLVDDRGRIIRANRIVETWNLGRVVDVKGQGVHELLHPDCMDVSCYFDSFWKQAWEGAMRGRPAQCEAYDEVLKRHVLVRVQPWKGEAVGSTVVTVQDITARKQAEEALKEYSERLEEMVEERTAELRWRNRELATLYEASTAISSDLSLNVVLQAVAEQMTQTLESSGCALSLWHRDRNLVETLVDYNKNWPDETDPPGTVYDLDGYPTTLRVLETVRPLALRCGDPSADPSELALMESQGVRALLMLPLIARDRVVGLVELTDDLEAREYTPQQVRLAESLAAQAAIAIENARLYEEIEERRMYLEAVLRAAPDAIITLDVRHRIVEWNSGAERLFGYSREEAIGHDLDDLITSPDILDEASGFTQVVLGGDELSPVEIVRYRKDSSPVDVILAASPILVGDELIGIVAVYTDITERRQAEEALRKSEEKYRTILENIEDSYYEVDLAGDLTFFNDSLCRLYGYPEDELMGMNYRQYMDGGTAKVVYQTFNAVYQTGNPAKAFDWEVIRKDGTRRFVEVSVSLIRDPTGEPIGFRGIIRDITERKRVEEALRDEKALMDALMDNITDSIYFKDRQCRLTRISRKMMRDLNLDEMSQAIGKTDVDLFGEEFGRKTLAEDQRIMATGEPLMGLIESRQLEDGQINWTLTTKVPLRDASGQIVGLAGITREINELMRVEEALRVSEERFALAVQGSNDGIWDWDIQNNSLYWSPRLKELLGYADDELDMDFDTFNLLLHPDDREHTEAAIEAHLKKRGPYDVEQRLRTKSGEYRWFRARGQALWDEAGNPLRMVGSTTDITERKRAEEALAKERNLLRTLIDNLPDFVYVKDAAGRYQVNNLAHARHLGFETPEAFFGKTVFEVFPPHLAEKFYADDLRVLQTGQAVIDREEPGVGRTPGTEVLNLTTKVPLRDNTGKIVGLVGITRDITERKRAEEQLQRYAVELERANEEVKQFAYIVSHDLRSPLVNLKGFATELRFALETVDSAMDTALPHLDEKQRQDVTLALEEDIPEALGFIESSVTHMDRFISALLKLSRLGHRELHPELVDMEALVQASLESLAYQIEERQVEVTVGPLPEVVADRTSMEQVMANLLDNTVKYLDPDRPGQIEITAERSYDETTFRIRDNGRGIAKEDMDKVFVPFRRVGRQDVPGEGMGLPYVQALVRRHGGRIWCESEPGVGTTFSFTISNHISR